MPDLASWLLLSAIPGIGAHRFHALLCRFGAPETVLNASLSELMGVPRLGPHTAAAIKQHRDHAFVDRQLQLAERHQVRIVTCHDDDYPARLRQIYDPPPLLFMRGCIRQEDERAVAIVGTRQTSSYGRRMTETFSAALCEYGITVVSGLARGIDTIAHRTALARGGRTVAVLGSGLDVPYPPENQTLMEEITAQGAVISEHPLGTEPDAMNFPQRNRIISGMSAGVLIIEAGEQSGALITAQYALDHDREVFAVPGPLTSASSRGANYLIKCGTAKLIQGIEDIIEELPPGLSLSALPTSEAAEPPRLILGADEECVYQFLSDKPQHIDRIAVSVGRTTSQTLGLLLSLELKDAVRQLPGKTFVRR